MQFSLALTIFLSALVAATPIPAAEPDMSLNEAMQLGVSIARRSVGTTVCDGAVSISGPKRFGEAES